MQKVYSGVCISNLHTQPAAQGREIKLDLFIDHAALSSSHSSPVSLEAQVSTKESSAHRRAVCDGHTGGTPEGYAEGAASPAVPLALLSCHLFLLGGEALATPSSHEDISTLNPTFLPTPRKKSSAGSL